MSEYRTALCCECGHARVFSTRAGLRNFVPEGCSPEQIRENVEACSRRTTKAAARSRAAWESKTPYHRWLADFRCEVCRRITRHALVAPPETRDGRDWCAAEGENFGFKLEPVPDGDGGWRRVWRPIERAQA